MVRETDVLVSEGSGEPGHLEPVGEEVDFGLVLVSVEDVVVDDGVFHSEAERVPLVGVGRPGWPEPRPKFPVNVLDAVAHVRLDDLVGGA